MEGGTAATLICISLSYHKPDFNKQCYKCVFCPKLQILPTYKLLSCRFNNDQGFLWRSCNNSWCNELQLCQNLEHCVKRAPHQKRLVLLRVKGIFKVIFRSKQKLSKEVFPTEINLKHPLLLTAMASFSPLTYAVVLQYWKPVNNLSITETESHKILNICEYPARRPVQYSL